MSWLSFLHEYDQIAIIDEVSDLELSYIQLYQRSCAWVDYLKEMGVDKDDRVAFFHQNCVDHLCLLFACARLNAIFVPLNYKAPQKENNKVLERVNPKLLIKKAPLLKYTKDYDFRDLDENDPVLMLFTSGSTGEPKGVLIHGKMIKANQTNTVENWALEKNDKTIVETPFFHTGAYNVLCLPLLSVGGQVTLVEKFCIDNFFKLLKNKRITVYFGVPTMFEMISSHPLFREMKNSCLRFVISGGAPCPEKIIKKYQDNNIIFKQGYGLTEVGPNCFLLEQKDVKRKCGSIGKPIKQSLVKILDKNNNEVTGEEIGELAIKGDHQCLGYFNDQESFKKRLVNGYYKTGDLVSCDSDGFFFVRGRKKEMYISGGENVYPHEVENVIMEYDGIIQAKIVSVPDEKWGEVGYLFYKAQDKILDSEISLFLLDKLVKYKHPKYFHQLKQFPLLANDKIDKKMLCKMAKDRA